jgi:phytanoyl-CoA hydroxylase
MNDSRDHVAEFAHVYDRDGVVTVPALFSPREVASIRDELAKIEREALGTMDSSDYVLEGDGRTVRNLWRLERYSEYFDALSRCTRLLEIVGPLVHGDPVVMGVESFNKPARVGSPVPPHQDNAYFCLRPPDALTVWIAIDSVTRENGPVQYLLGTHRNGIRTHVPSGVQGNSMGLRDVIAGIEPHTVLLAPGDATIHHCETIHCSGPNVSAVSRCGLLIVYRGAHCVTDETLRTNYAMAR